MAVTQYNIISFFKNSVIVSTVSIAVGLSLCLMFSYAVARMQWRLSGLAKTYISIGLFLPVQIVLVPLVIVVRDLHLTDSLLSIIVPYTAFSFPLATIILYGFYRNIPFELEESAAIDGASIFTSFLKIIMPMMKPAVATLIIFQFMNHWNEFTLALILISKESLKTLPLGLVYFQGQFSVNLGAMGASLVIASIPTILVYLFFSEHVEKAISVGAALKV